MVAAKKNTVTCTPSIHESTEARFRFFRSVIYTLDAESVPARVDWSCDARQVRKIKPLFA